MSNDAAISTGGLDAFRQEWQTAIADLAPQLVAELSKLPMYAGRNPEYVQQRVEAHLAIYTAYLVHPEDAQPPIADQMSGTLNSGQLYKVVLEAISHYRRFVLRAALQVAGRGVPQAEQGTENLMRIVDIAANEVVRYYIDQIAGAQSRLERSFAASPLATIEFDRDGLVTSWNASAERIFGWSAAEAIGQNVIKLLVPPMELDHVNAVVAALLDGQFANSRNMNITKDGRLITCQWHNAQLRDDQERVVGVLSQTEDITEQVEREQQLKTFFALAENATDAVMVFQPDGHVTYRNPALQQMFAGVAVRLDGAVMLAELVDPAVAAQLLQLQSGATWSGEVTIRRADGQAGTGLLAAFPITDDQQHELAIGALIHDITDQINNEAAQQQLQTQVISAQRAALRELSTPLIPIAAGVVAMPLIGTIDADRAGQVLEALLTGVSTQHAEIAILDITGVPLVDTQVADALMRAARAVGLLGGRVILTGIRPEVAQTLVGLGVDLSGIVTLSTLQAGIAHALKQQAAG